MRISFRNVPELFQEKMAVNQIYLTLAFWHVYFTTISEGSVN